MTYMPLWPYIDINALVAVANVNDAAGHDPADFARSTGSHG